MTFAARMAGRFAASIADIAIESHQSAAPMGVCAEDAHMSISPDSSRAIEKCFAD